MNRSLATRGLAWRASVTLVAVTLAAAVLVAAAGMTPDAAAGVAKRDAPVAGAAAGAGTAARAGAAVARVARAGTNAAARRNAAAIRALSKPFTIVALPDTQYYSADGTPYFSRQVHWVLTHVASRHIVFVTHLGDVVDNSFEVSQWHNAQQALSPLLRQTRLPFSIVRGNHDLAPLFLQNFPVSLMQRKPWFVGASPSGLTQAQTFMVQKARFLHIGFGYDPSAQDLAWANALVRRPAYKGMPVIVSTHDYMVWGGRTNVGDFIWNGFVRKDPMVFMVLCGHMHTEYSMVSRDEAGLPVYQMLSDYQDRENGGNGLMRLITVDPARGRIRVRTFSPYYDGAAAAHYETDGDSQFAYTLNVRARLAWRP